MLLAEETFSKTAAGRQNLAIGYAAQRDHFDIMDKLLSLDCVRNNEQNTVAIKRAVLSEKLGGLKKLLAIETFRKSADVKGSSAFYVVCSVCHTEAIQELLKLKNVRKGAYQALSREITRSVYKENNSKDATERERLSDKIKKLSEIRDTLSMISRIFKIVKDILKPDLPGIQNKTVQDQFMGFVLQDDLPKAKGILQKNHINNVDAKQEILNTIERLKRSKKKIIETHRLNLSEQTMQEKLQQKIEKIEQNIKKLSEKTKQFPGIDNSYQKIFLKLIKIFLAFLSFSTVLIPAIVYAVWKWKEKHLQKSPAEKSNSELDLVVVDETVFFKSYLRWISPFSPIKQSDTELKKDPNDPPPPNQKATPLPLDFSK